MLIPSTLDALRVPVDGLEHYPGNARRGDVDLIVSSLRRLGQYRPVVVNSRTHQVLAGNHTLRAARELGWSEIAATFVDVDDDTAARINLVDNRANDRGDYDEALLAEQLRALDDLDATGYDPHDLDEMLSRLDGGTSEPDEADTSPQLGDVEYRLVIVCSDEHEQAEWLGRLQAEGLNVQALAG